LRGSDIDTSCSSCRPTLGPKDRGFSPFGRRRGCSCESEEGRPLLEAVLSVSFLQGFGPRPADIRREVLRGAQRVDGRAADIRHLEPKHASTTRQTGGDTPQHQSQASRRAHHASPRPRPPGVTPISGSRPTTAAPWQLQWPPSDGGGGAGRWGQYGAAKPLLSRHGDQDHIDATGPGNHPLHEVSCATTQAVVDRRSQRAHHTAGPESDAARSPRHPVTASPNHRVMR